VTHRAAPAATKPPAGGGRSGTSLLGALRWFVIAYGFAVLGYLVTNAVASRWLGLTDFTDFVVVLTVSTVVGQLALVGVHRGGLRDAAVMGHATGDDEARLRALRAGARGARFVTLPAGAVLGAVVFYAVTDAEPLDRLVTAIAFGLLVQLNGLQKLWANYLRGLGRIRLASVLEGRSGGGVVSVVQAVLMVLAWQAFPDSGLTGAIVALLVGYAIPVAYAGRSVTRHWSHLPADGHLWRDLVGSVQRSWRFAVNQLSGYLSGTVELWIAAALLVDTQASLFSAAQRLALMLAIPLTSIQVVFAPVCARMLATGETDRLQRVLRTGATFAAIFSAVLLVPMLVIPGPVLGLVFSDRFQPAATVLFVLTLGNTVNVLTGLSGMALTMSHREGLVAAVVAAGVGLRIVLGGAAAYLFGLEGLAVTATAIASATSVVLWLSSRRLLSIWTHPTLRPSLGALRRTAG
jgi:O-antigen/teichoic acid export membrane protein